MIPGEELAMEGDVEAQCSVALHYEMGLEGAPDIQQAIKWWEMASGQGSSFASEKLVKLYSSLADEVSKGKVVEYQILAKSQGGGLSLNELLNETLGVDDQTVEVHLEDESVRETSQGKKILIVDDEEIVRELLQSLLEINDYTVLTAENGEEALDVVRKNVDIAALLVDFRMPKLNGLQFIKLIKKMGLVEGVPIVMITGNSDKNQVQEALKFGVRSWIVKPFDHDRVINTLESLGVSSQ